MHVCIYIYMHIQDGWTSLMSASDNGHQDVVQLLIKHDADVNHATKVHVCMYVCLLCVWLVCVVCG